MKTLRTLTAVLAAPMLLVACGQEGADTTAASPEQTGADQEVIQVENCGHTFEFAEAPERVVIQDVTSVQTLAELGVLDHVVAKAGFFPEVYFSDEVNAQLEEIPAMTDRLDSTGHIDITKEAVMAHDPDLIIGYSDAVNPENTDEVPVVTEPGFCGEVTNASWEDVGNQLDLYASIFQEQDRAEELKAELQDEVAEVTTVGEGQKVAFLYPGVDGGTTYGYGTDSMAHPVAETLGLENVFGDVSDRVFEISAEQLVAAEPDFIVILHSGEDGVIEAVTSLPGADAIPAVQNDAILDLPIAFVEPASPLSVDGVQLIEEALQS